MTNIKSALHNLISNGDISSTEASVLERVWDHAAQKGDLQHLYAIAEKEQKSVGSIVTNEMSDVYVLKELAEDTGYWDVANSLNHVFTRGTITAKMYQNDPANHWKSWKFDSELLTSTVLTKEENELSDHLAKLEAQRKQKLLLQKQVREKKRREAAAARLLATLEVKDYLKSDKDDI